MHYIPGTYLSVTRHWFLLTPLHLAPSLTPPPMSASLSLMWVLSYSHFIKFTVKIINHAHLFPLHSGSLQLSLSSPPGPLGNQTSLEINHLIPSIFASNACFITSLRQNLTLSAGGYVPPFAQHSTHIPPFRTLPIPNWHESPDACFPGSSSWLFLVHHQLQGSPRRYASSASPVLLPPATLSTLSDVSCSSPF